MTSKDLTVIMCAPLSDYPEAPADHSHSELFDCPKCKAKMWLSDKKKGVITFSAFLGHEILLVCYHCMAKEVAKNPEMFAGHDRVDL